MVWYPSILWYHSIDLMSQKKALLNVCFFNMKFTEICILGLLNFLLSSSRQYNLNKKKIQQINLNIKSKHINFLKINI